MDIKTEDLGKVVDDIIGGIKSLSSPGIDKVKRVVLLVEGLGEMIAYGDIVNEMCKRVDEGLHSWGEMAKIVDEGLHVPGVVVREKDVYEREKNGGVSIPGDYPVDLDSYHDKSFWFRKPSPAAS